MTPLDAARSAMRGPFDWATACCCRAACDAWALYNAQTDPLGAHRSDYSTLDEALRLARQHGSYRAWCDMVFADMQPGDGSVGDLVLVKNGGPFSSALGLSLGDGWAAVKGYSGMTIAKREILAGWTC